jgi:hypothetical protein
MSSKKGKLFVVSGRQEAERAPFSRFVRTQRQIPLFRFGYDTLPAQERKGWSKLFLRQQRRIQ